MENIRTITNKTDAPVEILIKITSMRCVGKIMTIPPEGSIILSDKIDAIGNENNKPITMLFKIKAAKCIGKKVVIMPDEETRLKLEVDIIEII